MDSRETARSWACADRRSPALRRPMARSDRIPALRQQGDSPPRVADGGGPLHFVFLPERANPRFFLWGTGAASSALAVRGRPERASIVDDTLTTRELDGVALPLLEALPRLAATTSSEVAHAPASLTAWSLAAKLALDLVGHPRIVPRVLPADGGREARFVVALTLAEDAERVSLLANAFPAAAHAVPVPSGAGRGLAPSRSFLYCPGCRRRIAGLSLCAGPVENGDERRGSRMTDPILESDPKLRLVVERLIEAYRPERIYLFGSVARGDAGPDSDYDVLVVVADDAPAHQQRSLLACEVLWDVRVAVDVVVWRESAFTRRARVPASLPATVLREGRLLHAA